MTGRKPLSRRDFLLNVAGMSGAALVLAACGNTPPPGGGTATGGEAASASAAASAGGPVAVASPTPIPDREATSGRASVIQIWYPYANPDWEKYWAAFEDSHPDIGIKAVFAANDTTGNAKFFTAVASGAPPDVTWVDGPQVAEWAARGTLEPLDERINGAGITAEDYWTPSWNQCLYNGKTWALTLTSDANFGFYWNKGIFEEAGLDPEKAPATIEEMDAANEKIAKVTDGRIDRLGFIPWIVYGSSNSMFTWGWVFGGEFFDAANNKITANNANNIKALDWMSAFAKKYDATQISGFIPGLTGPGGETGPFTTRKVAMTPGGPWEIPTLKTYAPDLEYGITFMPQGPGAEPNQSWVGGWTVGMPKGAKNMDPGWEFLQWISAGDGTNIIWDTFGNFPGYKQSPAYEKIAQDTTKKAFYDILVETKHQRPVMPAQAYFAAALQRAVDAAIYGQKTPQEALDEATTDTQKELDRILAEAVQ